MWAEVDLQGLAAEQDSYPIHKTVHCRVKKRIYPIGIKEHLFSSSLFIRNENGYHIYSFRDTCFWDFLCGILFVLIWWLVCGRDSRRNFCFIFCIALLLVPLIRNGEVRSIDNRTITTDYYEGIKYSKPVIIRTTRINHHWWTYAALSDNQTQTYEVDVGK